MALEMRLLHKEILVSPPFVARLPQGFGKVTMTDTSLGDHSPEGTAGLGQTGDSCQAEAET